MLGGAQPGAGGMGAGGIEGELEGKALGTLEGLFGSKS
jgi:hypothetical protein